MTPASLRQIGLLGSAVLLFACGMDSSLPKPPKPEPPGQAFTLPEEHKAWAKRVFATGFEEWAAWHTLGNKLASELNRHDRAPTTRDRVPTQEELQQAVYCFHQAMAAWPKEYPKEADQTKKDRHQPYPKDTLLSKGHAYMLLGENELGLFYYKLWKDLTPGTQIVDREIGILEERLKQTP